MEIKDVWTLRDRDEEIDNILSGKHKVNHILSAGMLKTRTDESSISHFQYIPDLIEKVLNDKSKGNNRIEG
jgi:hypothetical protein